MGLLGLFGKKAEVVLDSDAYLPGDTLTATIRVVNVYTGPRGEVGLDKGGLPPDGLGDSGPAVSPEAR